MTLNLLLCLLYNSCVFLGILEKKGDHSGLSLGCAGVRRRRGKLISTNYDIDSSVVIAGLEQFRFLPLKIVERVTKRARVRAQGNVYHEQDYSAFSIKGSIR